MEIDEVNSIEGMTVHQFFVLINQQNLQEEIECLKYCDALLKAGEEGK